MEGLDVAALFGPKEVRRADRFVQLAAVAADEAVESAGGIEALRGDPDRSGTIIGTGVGGLDTICEQHRVLLEKGPGRVSPFLVPMIMCNRASADISMRYGLRGPCEATVTACAAGAQSIANAGRLIASGRCDVMLAGGTEAPLSDLGIAGFANMTALSSSGVSMPFDVNRDGFVIGEGAGVIVLEERSTRYFPWCPPLRGTRRCRQHGGRPSHNGALARREWGRPVYGTGPRGRPPLPRRRDPREYSWHVDTTRRCGGS